ncbi:hypothetical protein GE107_17800 [Cohnella sp. CFH 77786]|uniref:DUF6483 family protein n=1 Tax=Cohnella sp. CFH 77786 TaxID=2662265 RepID=UPI001C60A37B|nr:DUF6483 family protein [Cohnella sp. CFH 77786]MBW5447911.1 hypothetical protein [Cohnella sp. CFH 77786]
MQERDYLMRLIQRAAQALGTIMGLREQKKQEQALEEIDEFLGRELRMRTRMAMGLSDEDLLAMLSVGGVPNPESVGIVAAFLQEEAELLSDLGRTEESVPRFAKALRLQLILFRENGGWSGYEAEERVRRLLESLAPYEWDERTIRAVWQWREAAGQYAEAENLLYELHEVHGAGAAEGLAFYDRLAALDDDALSAGGLSRPELEEGRRQWSVFTNVAEK